MITNISKKTVEWIFYPNFDKALTIDQFEQQIHSEQKSILIEVQQFEENKINDPIDFSFIQLFFEINFLEKFPFHFQVDEFFAQLILQNSTKKFTDELKNQTFEKQIEVLHFILKHHFDFFIFLFFSQFDQNSTQNDFNLTDLLVKLINIGQLSYDSIHKIFDLLFKIDSKNLKINNFTIQEILSCFLNIKIQDDSFYILVHFEKLFQISINFNEMFESNENIDLLFSQSLKNVVFNQSSEMYTRIFTFCSGILPQIDKTQMQKLERVWKTTLKTLFGLILKENWFNDILAKKLIRFFIILKNHYKSIQLSFENVIENIDFGKIVNIGIHLETAYGESNSMFYYSLIEDFNRIITKKQTFLEDFFCFYAIRQFSGINSKNEALLLYKIEEIFGSNAFPFIDFKAKSINSSFSGILQNYNTFFLENIAFEKSFFADLIGKNIAFPKVSEINPMKKIIDTNLVD